MREVVGFQRNPGISRSLEMLQRGCSRSGVMLLHNTLQSHPRASVSPLCPPQGADPAWGAAAPDIGVLWEGELIPAQSPAHSSHS